MELNGEQGQWREPQRTREDTTGKAETQTRPVSMQEKFRNWAFLLWETFGREELNFLRARLYRHFSMGGPKDTNTFHPCEEEVKGC